MSETIVIDGEVSLDIPVDGEAESIIKVGHEIVTRTLTVTENGHYEPDFGVDGFSSVHVEVPPYIPVTDTLLVDENGTYDVPEGVDGYSRVFVNVPKPPWSWMGSEVEHLSDLDYTETFTLADTDYPNWTPSTTYENIRDSHTAFTFTADMANYDYLAMFLMEFDPKYEENAMMVNKIKRAVGICYHPITRRPYAASDLENNILNLNICASSNVFTLFIYYNSSENKTVSVSNYGVYLYAKPPTVNDNIADSPIVTINTPIFRAVCNNSSFSTGSAAEIIPSQSTIKLKGEIYRMPKPNMQGWIYQQLVDIYNNGL